MRDVCDRCGREILGTLFPVPPYLGYDEKFVCQACYQEMCEEIREAKRVARKKRWIRHL